MREPLEVKWTDCGGHWELQIVHQEFRRHEFHNEQGRYNSPCFKVADGSLSLISEAHPQFARDSPPILFVRGHIDRRDNDICLIANDMQAIIERGIKAYNDANRYRLADSSSTLMSSEDDSDGDWEAKAKARRDEMLRQAFS